MKIVLAIVIGFFTLLGLAISGMWLLAWSETPKSHFATYEELVASGLMNRGWLPDYLPKSISNISEQHDIDTNYVWATFTYDRKDITVFESQCKVLVKSSEGTKYVCPPYERGIGVLILKPDGTATFESHSNEI